MRKFIPLNFLILFLLSFGVSAATSINFIGDSVNITSEAGQTPASSFIINNSGTGNLNINFSDLTLTKGDDKLSISALSNITDMDNNTAQSKSFSVVIPSQQIAGLYTGTLTGTSNESNTDTITVNVNVTPTYSVSTIPSSTMELGGASLNTTKTRTFNITNTGNANLTDVTFGFTDSNFNLIANKTDFTLPFNETETVSFNITIPASTSTGNITLGSVKMESAGLDQNLFSIEAEIGGGLTIDDLDVIITTVKFEAGRRKVETAADNDVNDGEKLNFVDKKIK